MNSQLSIYVILLDFYDSIIRIVNIYLTFLINAVDLK